MPTRALTTRPWSCGAPEPTFWRSSSSAPPPGYRSCSSPFITRQEEHFKLLVTQENNLLIAYSYHLYLCIFYVVVISIVLLSIKVYDAWIKTSFDWTGLDIWCCVLLAHLDFPGCRRFRYVQLIDNTAGKPLNWFSGGWSADKWWLLSLHLSLVRPLILSTIFCLVLWKWSPIFNISFITNE